ncbi:MAG: cytochrome c [Thermoleophilia bacterium]|jgi:mono/diheme cytochrome c family protein|nr:cytochrome c [Thermoleophilia bacterium]
MRKSLIPGVVAVAAAAALLAGCGAGTEIEQADLANGKTQFSQKCGGCHTMEDAGSNGISGPNMDDAFRGSRQQGFKESSFYGVVHEWIRIAPQDPQPGGAPVVMPRDLVTGDDARDVAAYVARFAGTSEDSAVRKLQPEVAGEAPGPLVWEQEAQQQEGN